MSAVRYLVRADLDKPHRCPSCYQSGASQETDWAVKIWHAYTCPRCGQRFARRLFLPVHPEGFHYGYRVRFSVWFRHWFINPLGKLWWLRLKPWTRTVFWHRYMGYVVCDWLGHSYARKLTERGNEDCDCGADHTYLGCVRCRAAFDPDD
jgi:ribosomal protein L37AE/L43A